MKWSISDRVALLETLHAMLAQDCSRRMACKKIGVAPGTFRRWERQLNPQTTMLLRLYEFNAAKQALRTAIAQNDFTSAQTQLQQLQKLRSKLPVLNGEV